jgi:hypothetical protein
MFQDQNAGKSHSIKIVPLKGSKSSNIWEQQEVKVVQEEIKIRMNSENVWYHSVQNLMSSSLLSKK